MKFNFKKIAPICAGAILLGSTIGFAGALAADVSYPTDFANAVVVIGAAGAADMSAANVIANQIGALTTGVSTSVSSGLLLSKGTTHLNYGSSFSTVDSSLSSSDVPSLLTDVIYHDNKGTNKADYDTTESIDFTPNADLMAYTTPNRGDNRYNRGPYVELFKDVKNTPSLNYTIKFSGGADYDNSTTTALNTDFANTKVTMLGKTWTITKAEGTSSGLTKLTLLGGATSTTIDSGKTQSVVVNGKTYSVTPTVYDTDSTVSFTINGETLTGLSAGDEDTLSDGTNIGVTTISSSSKESVPSSVEFIIGASKLVLENGQKVNLDESDVDSTLVTINQGSKQLNSIVISMSPSEDSFIGTGQSWTDPVFGAMKVVFGGLDQKTEDIVFKGSTDTATITYKNFNGDNTELDLVTNMSSPGSAGAEMWLGDDRFTGANLTVLGQSGKIGNQGNMLVADGDSAFSNNDLTNMEGLRLLVTDSDGQSRMIDLDSVDLTKSQITFKDEVKDTKTTVDFVNGSNSNKDVGFGATVDFIVNQSINSTYDTGTGSYINFTRLNSQTDNRMLTSLEGQMGLRNVGNNIELDLYNSTNDGKGLVANFSVYYDTSNKQVEANSPQNTGGMDAVTKDSDTQTGIDSAKYGALVTYDTSSSGRQDLSIAYPESKTIADVYIAPVGAIVSGGGIATVVKDSDIGDAKSTKDLIVVGGSAVNQIAAELLKVTYPTYGVDPAWTTATGVGPDMAIIKLFSATDKDFGTGNVALLVAGYEAKDTQAAAKALTTDKKFGVLKTTTASAYSYA